MVSPEFAKDSDCGRFVQNDLCKFTATHMSDHGSQKEMAV